MTSKWGKSFKEAINRLYQYTKARKTVMMVLSCFVVFVTTYLLILPAITLDQDEAEKQGGIDVPKQTREIEDVPVKDLDQESGSEDPGSNAIVLKTEPDVQEGSISYTGKGYEVSADCDGAGLPEGTKLTAEEISKSDDAYNGMYQDALKAVQKDSGNKDCELAFAKFYDITLTADGFEVEPESPVDVTISYEKALKASDVKNLHIVHFVADENGDLKPEVLNQDSVDAKIKSGKMSETTFAAESFSVYAVVYTVDFSWEVDGKKYDFSLPGGGYVSFEALMEVLNVVGSNEEAKQFTADVENVEFSDSELLWVGKAEDETTVGELKEANGLDCQYSAELTKKEIEEIDAQTVDAGDWALISLKPFDTEESLTITMKDGNQFVVKVTDARIGNNLDGQTFIIETLDDPPLAMTSTDSYNYDNKRLFRASTVTGNNDQIWVLEYDGRYDNTYRIKSVAEGEYIRLDGSHDDGFTLVPNENDLPSLFWIDYDSATDTYEFSTNSPSNNYNIRVYLNTLYDNNSPRFTMGNESQRFKLQQATPKEENAKTGDWLLFLDEDQDEIYIRVGETISLRPFDEWTWKEAAIQSDHWNFPEDTNAPTNWDISSNAANESSQSSWTASNGTFTFNRHIKYDNQLEVRYWSVQGQAQAVGDYVLTNTRNGHQITVHVISEDDPYHKLTPFTGQVPIKVNLFDYDLGKRLDPSNNSNTETGIVNQAVNINHLLHFLSSGNSNGNSINHYTKDNNNPGIVANTLDENGYPVLASNGESLQYLFDTSKTSWQGGNYNDAMIAYPNVGGLFQQDKDGYYYFNSNSNYAYYDAANNSMLLYPHTYTQVNKDSKLFNSKPIGFFPFHEYESANVDHLWVNQNQYLNHHIGMSLDLDFEIPKDKTTENGKHIVYEFSGDDDLWVFIDDELVLDIGGVHQPLGGKIDFTEGKVYVYNANGTSIVTKTFDVGAHNLKMFYLERGGCDSNLSLKMNMPLILGPGDVELFKADSNDQGLPDAVFGIWETADCSGEPYAVATSDTEGVVFKSLPVRVEGQVFYIREILAPDGYALDDTIFKATAGTYNATTGRYPFTITKLTAEGEVAPSDTHEVGGKQLPAILDADAIPIDLSVQKKWQDAAGNEIEPPAGASVKFLLKRTMTYSDAPVYTVRLRNDSSDYTVYDTITAREGDVLTITYAHNPDNTYREINCWSGNGVQNILSLHTNTTGAEERTQYTVNPAHASGNVIDIIGNNWWLEWCDPNHQDAQPSCHFPRFAGIKRAPYEVTTKEDTEFNQEGRSVTLPTTQGAWTDTFDDLPVQEVKNGIVYQYKYYIEEDASGSNMPDGYETVYMDRTGTHPINGTHSQETASTGTTQVINQKLLDIPVTKIWPDYENNYSGTTFDWEVDLQLDYRDVPVDGQGQPTKWKEYQPDNEKYQKKLTKAHPNSMFEDLPMYVYDKNGRKFRREYSVVEKGYLVKANGEVIASHIGNTYTPSDKRYTLWYEHDAGENSTDLNSYYISVYNMHENRDVKEDITIDIKKTWKNAAGENITPGNDYKAKFKLRRNVLVEYRNHEDETLPKSEWVTVHLVTDDPEHPKTLVVPPGTEMFIRGNLKDGASPANIKFTRNDNQQVLTAEADSQFQEEGYKLFEVSFIAPTEQRAVVTVTMNQYSDENVVGGTKGFILSDSSDRQFFGRDETFLKEFELSNAKGWSKHFPDTTGTSIDDKLPVVEVSELDAEGKTANTYIYTYYFEEVMCEPEDFYAIFTDDSGNILGDASHQIYSDAVITAANELKPGSINIKKNVKVNGENVAASDPNTQFVDGTYTFRIEGVPDTPTANVPPRTATVTITNGQSNTVEVKGLAPGQYKVTELATPNGTSLIGNEEVFVTVEKDVTGTDAPTVEMTNNRELTKLKVKKQWAATSPENHPTDVTFRLFRVGYYLDDEQQRPASEGYYPDDNTTYLIHGAEETTVPNLPVHGVETVSGIDRFVTYEYHVVEQPISGETTYWPSYSTEGDTTVITNTPVEPPEHTTKVNVSKVWNDEETHDDDQIEFTLKAVPHNTGYVPVHLVYINADNTTWKQQEVFVKKNEKLNFTFRKGGTIASHQIVITEGSRQTTTGGEGKSYSYQSNTITDETTITLRQRFSIQLLSGRYYDRWGDDVEIVYSDLDVPVAYQWTSTVTATGDDPLYNEYESFYNAKKTAQTGDAIQLHYTLGKNSISGDETYEGQITGNWAAKFENLPEFQKLGDEYVVMTYEISELKIKRHGMDEEVVGPTAVSGYQGESTNYLVNWTQNGDSWTVTNTAKPGLDIIIRKTDTDGTALAGAVFEISKKDGAVFTKLTHTEYDWLDDNDQFTVPEEGKMLTELPDGMYQIREVSPPLGYVITSEYPVTFEIEHGAVVRSSNALTDGVTYTAATESSKDTYTIPNTFATALPNAGGPGTTWIYLFGCLLFIGCSILLVARRRMEH